MLTRLFFLTTLLWVHDAVCQHSQTPAPTAHRTIQVRFHKNVELLGFAYFLSYEGRDLENDEGFIKSKPIRKKEWYGYGFSLYQRYKSYQNNQHLVTAMRLAEHLWLDYLINLLLQLDEFPRARLLDRVQESHYLRFSTRKDPAEARKNTEQFLEAMNRFCEEVNFDDYMTTNQRKYDNALAQVRTGLPDNRFIPALEAFYEQHFQDYTLMPSLTIPTGMGFGPRYTLDGKTHIFTVFGPFNVQHFSDETKLDMGFGDLQHLKELSTHEFGHSFVNHIVNEAPAGLIRETEKLFTPIKEKMTSQGYPTWNVCLIEHFVRAGEIVIAQNLGNRVAAEHLKDHYINTRKFIYLPVILRELESYNENRSVSYAQAVEKAMRQLKTE
ncbi:hypothetical protein GCM10028803_23580 [Larkinella knui]|uniref:DUF4932 domain-containing protein n=1 Tax=Larkinella knui TaxID=2025310 RepID=A0A3P1CX29_9BACT|nr:DUF4932 domain-containing protein [Larkinella knui]RRB17424.1 DUF4932 domain-containing protein [Larkinella knui]